VTKIVAGSAAGSARGNLLQRLDSAGRRPDHDDVSMTHELARTRGLQLRQNAC
jgi:hypothetical protein